LEFTNSFCIFETVEKKVKKFLLIFNFFQITYYLFIETDIKVRMYEILADDDKDIGFQVYIFFQPSFLIDARTILEWG
jgi:hypothetical protein